MHFYLRFLFSTNHHDTYLLNSRKDFATKPRQKRSEIAKFPMVYIEGFARSLLRITIILHYIYKCETNTFPMYGL